MTCAPDLIFDGDLPMGWSALDMNRDLTLSVPEIREAEIARGVPGDGRMLGTNVVSLPELRRGRVAAVLAKVVGRRSRPGAALWGYNSPEGAYAGCWTHLEYYRCLASRGWARIIASSDALTEHIRAWESDTTDRIGMIIGMEGADPILWPEQVHEWWRAGVRVLSLTHYGPSTYGHGTGSTGPVTGQGRALLREMERCGMILDLTHTADETFWQALDVFAGPVIASHQNCRALVPRQRQFSDDQLRAVLRRGAVIGVSFDAWMLVRDWEIANKDRRKVSLEHVVDQIDHICQVAGNASQVGIGGDLDGGQGYEGFPRELDTVADLQRLAGFLERRGYSTQEVAGIMSGNWVRYYRRNLPLY
jgi:membrane dipeptidase